LILSGCGGDKKAGSTTDTTAAPEQTTTTTTIDPALIAADTAYGQKAVLVQTDLPAGWIASAPKEDSPAAAAAAELLNNCVGIPKNSEIRIMKVSGNDFKNGNNTIASSVRSFKNAKLVQQDLSGTNNPKNFSCIANVIDAQLATEIGDGRTSSTVARLPNVATGESQFALRVTTILTINGTTTNVYSDILGITNGRYEATVNVTYFEAPAPAAFDKALLGAVTRHMAAITS
jgi:hypothetical protein